MTYPNRILSEGVGGAVLGEGEAAGAELCAGGGGVVGVDGDSVCRGAGGKACDIAGGVALRMHIYHGTHSVNSKATALSLSSAAILYLKKNASAFEPWIWV
jgi:hypothetical protein